MPQLFYTNSVAFNKPQPISANSIGGFISSSNVANDVLNGLFGDISNYTLYYGKNKEYRAIALYNDEEVTMEGTKIWFEFVDPGDSSVLHSQITDLAIASVNPKVDDCGDLYTEKLASIYSKPMSVSSFTDGAYSEGAALYVGNIEPGDYKIIFLQRTIKASAKAPISDDILCDISDGTISLEKLENPLMHISWQDPSEDSDSI